MSHSEKFASVCMVLATRVSVLAALAVGKSCVRRKRFGARMAGQMRRRKTQALIRWSLTSVYCICVQQ